jgi:hypothetical protein
MPKIKYITPPNKDKFFYEAHPALLNRQDRTSPLYLVPLKKTKISTVEFERIMLTYFVHPSERHLLQCSKKDPSSENFNNLYKDFCSKLEMFILTNFPVDNIALKQAFDALTAHPKFQALAIRAYDEKLFDIDTLMTLLAWYDLKEKYSFFSDNTQESQIQFARLSNPQNSGQLSILAQEHTKNHSFQLSTEYCDSAQAITQIYAYVQIPSLEYSKHPTALSYIANHKTRSIVAELTNLEKTSEMGLPYGSGFSKHFWKDNVQYFVNTRLPAHHIKQSQKAKNRLLPSYGFGCVPAEGIALEELHGYRRVGLDLKDSAYNPRDPHDIKDSEFYGHDITHCAQTFTSGAKCSIFLANIYTLFSQYKKYKTKNDSFVEEAHNLIDMCSVDFYDMQKESILLILPSYPNKELMEYLCTIKAILKDSDLKEDKEIVETSELFLAKMGCSSISTQQFNKTPLSPEQKYICTLL